MVRGEWSNNQKLALALGLICGGGAYIVYQNYNQKPSIQSPTITLSPQPQEQPEPSSQDEQPQEKKQNESSEPEQPQEEQKSPEKDTILEQPKSTVTLTQQPKENNNIPVFVRQKPVRTKTQTVLNPTQEPSPEPSFWDKLSVALRNSIREDEAPKHDPFEH